LSVVKEQFDNGTVNKGVKLKLISFSRIEGKRLSIDHDLIRTVWVMFDLKTGNPIAG
jgi:hypothetical protein